MHVYLSLFGLRIPSYGFFIALGVILANMAALFVLKKTGQDFNDFTILEAYCILGAFTGAKVLYLMVSFEKINWKRVTDSLYFSGLMQKGFVFYGGLIGGLLFVFMAGKFHKIKSEPYIRNFVFLIPFIHGFGRIGCFMAGCCYGIPYKGIGAVVFPEGSYALAGVSLFPVQLLEAILLIMTALILINLQIRKKWFYTIETYLLIYGIIRFCLEYLRYDEERGSFAGLSTSQWISIALILGACTSIFVNRKKRTGRCNA